MGRFTVNRPEEQSPSGGRFTINRNSSAPSGLDAFLSGAGDAITFGWGDELQGLGASLIGMDGQEVTEAARRWQQLANYTEPGWFLGGQFGGALGGVGRAAGAGVGHIWREGVRPAFSAQERAARAIMAQGIRYGQTPQELQKAVQGAAPNATMMDVQAGGPALVMGAASRPSAGREAFREALDERNNAMADDAATDLWESTLGKKSRIDAGRRINEIEDLKKKITYDDIDAGPAIDLANTSGNRALVDFVTHHRNQPGAAFKNAIEETLEEMRVGDPNKTGLRAVGDAQMDYTHMTSPAFWRSLVSKVREEAQGAVRAAKISGIGKSAARRQMLDYSQFRKEVGRVLGPEWEKRQGQYRALAEEGDYLKFGYETIAKVLNKGGDINIGKFMSRFSRLTDQQKQYVRQGALARVEDVMNSADTQTGRADVLRSIIGTKSKINVLNNVLGGVKKDGGMDMRHGFAKVLKRLEQQREYFANSVQSGIGVNSHTADKLLAAESLRNRINPTGGSSGVFGALWDIVRKPKADAFDEEVSNHILSAMSRNPRELLAEISAAGGPEKWANQVGMLARLNRTMIGAERPSVQALAAARQREAAQLRPRQFQDSLYNGLFLGVGGGALGSDY